MQEEIQQAQGGNPFQGITASDIRDASPEEFLFDESSDGKLDCDKVDI